MPNLSGEVKAKDILDNIEIKFLGYEMKPLKLMNINLKEEPPTRLTLDRNHRWSMFISIGTSVVGPEEARDHLARHVRNDISNFLYGEVKKQLFDIESELLYDGYYDNPAIKKIRNLIESLS